MLARPVDGGVEIAIRVAPGASRTRIVGRYGDRLKVQVSAPPERGKANRLVCQVIAETFGVPPSAVEVVKGHASPDKIVAVRGVGIDVARRVVDNAS